MTYSDERISSILASIGEDDRALIAPPPSVWDAIVSQLGADRLDTSVRSGDAAGAATDTDRVLRPASPSDSSQGGDDASSVVPLHGHRGRPMVWMTVAAATVALLVGALVAVTQPSTTVVSEVALSSDGLDGAPSGLQGSAELVETADALELQVDIPADIDTDGGYLELWLIDTRVEGMVSLGPVNDTGRYQVPPGVDPGLFPVVDVSVEPTDGLPTHSGKSVLRGVLDA